MDKARAEAIAMMRDAFEKAWNVIVSDQIPLIPQRCIIIVHGDHKAHVGRTRSLCVTANYPNGRMAALNLLEAATNMIVESERPRMPEGPTSPIPEHLDVRPETE